jgi:hypothetical protein
MSSDATPSIPPSAPPLPPVLFQQSVPKPEAEPRPKADLLAAIVNPLRAVDVVLATPSRSRSNVERNVALVELILLLVASSAIYAIPFGLVLGWEAWWKIGVLTLGSTLICLPSLHVFGAFIGLRTTPAQITALAMTLPAAAALFSAGFAPILAFLRATFDPSSDTVTWISLAKVLLGASLVAGGIQLARTVPRSRDERGTIALIFLIPAWLAVLAYVLVRMVRVLDLFG